MKTSGLKMDNRGTLKVTVKISKEIGIQMQTEKKFLIQLENFHNEVKVVTEFVCTDMAIDHAISKSKVLLHRLNKTPTFWIATQAAFQVATYISLGRIFDDSVYNIHRLMASAVSEIALFQRDALAKRKREGHTSDPAWLNDYLNDAFYPTADDFAHLKKRVSKFRKIYDETIKPARNKHIAHREKYDDQEVSELYGCAKIKTMWEFAVFLQQLAVGLQELYENGKKPEFSDIPLSDDEMIKPTIRGLEIQARIVRETQELMQFIEKAPWDVKMSKYKT